MHTRCLALTLALALLFTGSSLSCAQESFTMLDYRAIQNSIVGYLQAINAKDSVAAAQYWSVSGEWVADSGKKAVGRDAIEAALAKSFAGDASEIQLRLESVSIRAISSNVAMEDGTAVIQTPGLPDERSNYTVVHVREKDGWKISAIRQTVDRNETSDASAPEGIEQLGWMVGTWHDDSDPEERIVIRCEWMPGKRALRRKFETGGESPEHLATQIILWDAKQATLRSWVYDTAGNFGNGIWTRTNDATWQVSSVLQSGSGQQLMSTNTYRAVNSNTFEFGSINRKVDGRDIDDIPPMTISKVEERTLAQELTATATNNSGNAGAQENE
ncbi:MAG: YybH family protein [Aureliella sp.]